jgi:serine/threonine-protein kinase
VLDTLGRDEEAIADYCQALRLEPYNARLHESLEWIHYARPDTPARDPVQALAHTKREVELDPQNFEFRVRLVVAYLRLARYEGAREALDAALRLNPVRSAETAGALTLVYMTLGDYDAALPHARAWVELAPDLPWPHSELGHVYAVSGEDNKALAEISEGIRLIARPHDAGNQYMFRDRGDLYVKRKQYAAVLADYDRAVEVSLAFSYAYKRRAEAHFHLGNYRAAQADIAKAVALNPDDASNVTWIKPESIAACPDAAFRQGVLDLATRTVELTQGKAEAYASRALLYQVMGEEAKARDDWTKAAQLLAGQAQLPDATECLALAYVCIQQLPATAVRCYERAFAALPALADNLPRRFHYKAARAAALAGCGRGRDAEALGAAERTRLRQQALTWLRADLAAWGRRLDRDPDQFRSRVADTLRHWLGDPDFAGVRGDAIARLPEAERAGWQKLWADVAARLAPAGGAEPKQQPAAKP